MALHGHTKIELTNVETGEVETYEDDNLVTNGIAELLNPTGIFENRTYGYLYNNNNVDTYNHIKTLTGGLLLFDNDVPADVTQMWPNENQNLVGMGTADRVYNGTNFLAGSYSVEESGISEDGHSYTHVWDFTTAQANGDIKTVCLTTASGGIMGAGYDFANNDSVWKNTNRINSQKNALYKNYVCKESIPLWIIPGWENNESVWAQVNFDPLYFTENYFIAMDYTKSPYFVPGSNSGSPIWGTLTQEILNNSILKNNYFYLSLYKTHIEDFNLFSNNLITYHMESAHISKNLMQEKKPYKTDIKIELLELADIITEEMCTLNSNYYFNWESSCDNGYLYIYLTIHKNTGIAPGEPLLYIWKINIEDYSVEFQTVLNITDTTINITMRNTSEANQFLAKRYVGCNFRRQFFVTNESILVLSNNKCYIINTSDINNLEAIDIWDSFSPLGLAMSYYSSCSFYNGYYILWQGHDTNWNNTDNSIMMINSKTGEIKHLASYLSDISNALFFGSNNIINVFTIYGNNAAPKFIKYSHYYRAYDPVQNYGVILLFTLPSILITINNLPETITKNSNQTMKVIYTLTEEGY